MSDRTPWLSPRRFVSVYMVVELPAAEEWSDDDVLQLVGDSLGDFVQYAVVKPAVYGTPGDFDSPPGWYADKPEIDR